MGKELVAGDLRHSLRQKAALHLAAPLQIEVNPLTCQLQLPTVFLQVDLQAAKLRVRLDAGMHLFHLKWLGEVTPPANGERLHLVQGFGESTDKDDGNPLELLVGFEMFANLIAVHL